MSALDDLEAAAAETLTPSERRSKNREIRELEKQVERLERELGLVSRLTDYKASPPKWLRKSRKAGVHQGTLVHLLSDLHFDEVVRPAELFGYNAYDRRIATLRLERDVQNVVKVSEDYFAGVSYDGIVVPLLGDNFSGDIHEELVQTNEDTMLGGLDYWIPQMMAALTFLADAFGKVYAPVVVGNHGRRTRKNRGKLRARDNFDWFFGRAIADRLKVAGDDRITMDVGEAPDAFFQVYGTRFLATHGDAARGGAGIGGIWPPIMRLDARTKERNTVLDVPYDHMILGHWHQLTFGQQFTVNGSMKGYDEYAFNERFRPEPPAQALMLVTPEHGVTHRTPIFSQQRDKEGW